MSGRVILQGHQAEPEGPRIRWQFPQRRAPPDLDSTMHVYHAELSEVPIENGQVGTTDTVPTSDRSVLEKGLMALIRSSPPENQSALPQMALWA